MSANFNRSKRTQSRVSLAGPQESLIQITFKLKNVVLHVSL
jgi:hypothetical protein